jgi:hypothetical protein
MTKMTLLVGESWTLSNGITILREPDIIGEAADQGDSSEDVVLEREEMYTIFAIGIDTQSFKTLGDACFEANHTFLGDA